MAQHPLDGLHRGPGVDGEGSSGVAQVVDPQPLREPCRLDGGAVPAGLEVVRPQVVAAPGREEQLVPSRALQPGAQPFGHECGQRDGAFPAVQPGGTGTAPAYSRVADATGRLPTQFIDRVPDLARQVALEPRVRMAMAGLALIQIGPE